MMDLATLMIQTAFVAFLAWGGVLSLLCTPAQSVDQPEEIEPMLEMHY